MDTSLLPPGTIPRGKDVEKEEYSLEAVKDFLSKNKDIRATKGKELWQSVAFVLAKRLLHTVQTLSKKDLQSQGLRSLTTSAAIAYDKGFPKDEHVRDDKASVTYNNLFLNSDIGEKVKANIMHKAQVLNTKANSIEETTCAQPVNSTVNKL